MPGAKWVELSLDERSMKAPSLKGHSANLSKHYWT